MKLSIIIPTLDGKLPIGLPEGDSDTEIIVVKGISPVGKARNAGLERATGEYIAWIDADDEITADWLPEIFAAIDNRPDIVVLDAVGVGWRRFFGGAWNAPSGQVSSNKLMHDIYAEGVIAGAMWQFVSKRSLWDGVRFDEAIQAWEDYILLPELCAKAKKVWHIAKPIYKYIKHAGSLVNTSTPSREDSHLSKIISRECSALSKWKYHATMATARECYWIWRRSRNSQAWQYVSRHLIFLELWSLLHCQFRWMARYFGMLLKVL